VSTDPQPTTTQAPAPAPAAAPQPNARPAGTQAAPQQAVPLPQHKIRHTRISGLWFAIGFFALLLLFLLIFILENSSKVDISFLGAHGHIPLGVALLFAAVCGVLLAVLAGVARIAQLHSVARRHRRVDAGRAAAAAAPPAAAPPAAAPPASTPATAPPASARVDPGR
jgi:lipopolysaccharide assembly protein A